jgi:hypothetical protein
MNENPIGCDLTAIPAEQRAQHEAITKQLFAAVQEIRELPDGYAFRLLEEPGMLIKTAEFVKLERLCCPFFGFALEVEPRGGSLKEFIQSEFVRTSFVPRQ